MAAPARNTHARGEPSGSIADCGGRAPIRSIPLFVSLRPAPPGQCSERNAEGRIPGCRAPSHGSLPGRGRGSAAQRPQAAGGGAAGRGCWGAADGVRGAECRLWGALGAGCGVHGGGAVCSHVLHAQHVHGGHSTHGPCAHALLATLQHPMLPQHPAESSVLARPAAALATYAPVPALEKHRQK